jgi:hypothetical protein
MERERSECAIPGSYTTENSSAEATEFGPLAFLLDEPGPLSPFQGSFDPAPIPVVPHSLRSRSTTGYLLSTPSVHRGPIQRCASAARPRNYE